jgi:hypothetical protein
MGNSNGPKLHCAGCCPTYLAEVFYLRSSPRIDEASTMITATPRRRCLMAGKQDDWRLCKRCVGLFYAPTPSGGACPAGGQHVTSGGNYIVTYDGSGQPEWRWCRDCAGLWYAGGTSEGACPAGGGHSQHGSGNYTLRYDADAPGQDNWRWCKKCQGLWYAGSEQSGVCPAGGGHIYAGSGNYRLEYEDD